MKKIFLILILCTFFSIFLVSANSYSDAGYNSDFICSELNSYFLNYSTLTEIQNEISIESGLTLENSLLRSFMNDYSVNCDLSLYEQKKNKTIEEMYQDLGEEKEKINPLLEYGFYIVVIIVCVFVAAIIITRKSRR